jgi:hypothetical protein
MKKRSNRTLENFIDSIYRNQTFNSAGNVVAAVAMGLIGYFLSNRGISFFVVDFTIPTLWALARILSRDIDYSLARGSDTVTERSASLTSRRCSKIGHR